MARPTRAATFLPELLNAEARRRLAAGEGIREVSRGLRLNRDTVRAIDRDEYEGDCATFQRCDQCGHLVLFPCRICLARRHRP